MPVSTYQFVENKFSERSYNSLRTSGATLDNPTNPLIVVIDKKNRNEAGFQLEVNIIKSIILKDQYSSMENTGFCIVSKEELEKQIVKVIDGRASIILIGMSYHSVRCYGIIIKENDSNKESIVCMTSTRKILDQQLGIEYKK